MNVTACMAYCGLLSRPAVAANRANQFLDTLINFFLACCFLAARDTRSQVLKEREQAGSRSRILLGLNGKPDYRPLISAGRQVRKQRFTGAVNGSQGKRTGH